MVYKSKHFKIHELVPRELFELLHEDALWKLFDRNYIDGIDYLKEKFPEGQMTINNWFWREDGELARKESGIRIKTDTHYSERSQHSIGSAVDFQLNAYANDEVFRILEKDREIRKYFTRIEHIQDAPTWIHLDQKPIEYPDEYLYVFRA